MDTLSVPEQAISAFERVHEVLVTVHDFSGRIKQRLAINRTFHRHPLCHAAKARDHERGCLAFDLVALHAQAPLHPQGFLQRCHAGLVEAVVPLRVDGEVMGIVMAGVRAQGEELPLTRSLPQAPDIAAPRLPTWTKDQALTVLECLRQLAARLEVWLASTDGDGVVGASDRRSTILHVISHGAPKGVTLPQLAARLGLSADRTGHVVREEFGITFLDLVNQHRLERAAALLKHSDLPIATIALNSGFGDVSTFHRRFRAQFKMTPRAFRVGEKAKKKG
jgi:AraC-like DNA-binding protein